MDEGHPHSDERGEAVAIIGMACRVPGAENVDAFWEHLRNGIESITSAGEHVEASADGRRRVFARGLIRDVDRFDAGFFGMSAAEAAMTDPQARVFLECAWEALERTGYDPKQFAGAIGIYGGSGPSGYWIHHVAPAGIGFANEPSVTIANDKDHLTTRTAYKLGLTGPAITVQTTCSTSLVAVQLAWQALLTYQCDIALAGGVSIAFPLDVGYQHQEGFILSPDGHCRAFDAQAAGTVPGDGAGIVVLKRLSDAMKDGDHIHAVLLGAAVNNDGAEKVGYTAPSIQGQAQVIAMAHAVAQVDADSIGYIEAHGTGTRLGDPIEVAALTQAFRTTSQRNQFCAIGSVKTNLGHLNAAAGVTSLIKAVLAIEHQEIPPSLHFQRPNPELNLESTPFFVNATLRHWESETPRRAGVSAFGFGGTNAHVVLEERPVEKRRGLSESPFLLVLSARTKTALDAATKNLREYLEQHPDANLVDVAYTLQVGRRPFEFRRTIVCRDVTDAISALGETNRQSTAFVTPGSEPDVVFMFSGQGAQYPGMGRFLYQRQPSFRGHFDAARSAFSKQLSRDLLELLDPAHAADLERTEYAQPAIAAIDYALAHMWMEFGVQPRALLGHSLGEYVAACIAGVLSLDDMASIVTARGRLMQELPEGAMISIPLPEKEIVQYLTSDVDIAAILEPSLVVASGPKECIENLVARLAVQGIPTRRLAVSRAFHSAMMDPILPRFLEVVRRAKLHRPAIRCLSGLTGTWLTEEEAQSPTYWVNHLRRKTRLDDCLKLVPRQTLVEVGPGTSLGAIAARIRENGALQHVVTSFGRPGEDEFAAVLHAAGRLFLAGHALNWETLYTSTTPRRVPLPTYPFERERHFIDAPNRVLNSGGAEALELERKGFAQTEREIRDSLAIRSIDEYPGLVETFDTYCARHVLHYFETNGVDVRAGVTTSREVLGKTLHVVPKFVRLLDAMMAMLEADGIVRVAGAEIRFTEKTATVKPLKEIRAKLEASYPQFGGLYRFIDHCAKKRYDAMSGRIEAIGVLFPGGSSDFVDSCERDTIEHRSERIYIRLLCEIARRIVDASDGKNLRILEVGGGRGTLTFPLLEALSRHDVEYHFTDIGRVFVEDAREEATRRGLSKFMRFGVLDISKDLQAQGYAAQNFDLIVAYNVIHATPNVPATLEMLEGLLAPTGTMALVELVKIRRWDTLTWGLAEGWWYFDDDVRRDSPLLDLASWEKLFQLKRFARVEAYPRDERERGRMDHGLILARREKGIWSRPLTVPAPLRDVQPFQSANVPFSVEPLPRQLRPNVETLYVAPRTQTEQRIATIISRLLGIDRIGVHDDVFLLGADSLIMLRITDRIRREFGRDVPAHLAFRGATVERLAAALDNDSAPSPGDSIVIPLQPLGFKRPIFFVHPAAGVVFPYVELSRRIGQDRPFYGLQAWGLDGVETPDTTVEQMARRYVEAMRRVQTEGPYYVGGFSFGCFVAFEIAQELARQGQRAAFVALVDEPAPIIGQRPSPLVLGKLLATGIGRSIWPHLHDYFYLSRNAGDDRPSTSFDISALLKKTPDGGLLETFLARSTMANYVPPESMLLALRQPAMLPMFRLFMLHLQATYAYRPSAYSGALTLFKATRIGGHYDRDPAWGWGMLAAGGVKVIDVPGEHLTVIRTPHVDVLADRLRVCLDEADGRVTAR